MKRISNLILILICLVSISKGQPGSIDTSFKKDLNFHNSNQINSVAIQSDGKILIGGIFSFNLYNRTLARNIVRLNPDGTSDTNFIINNHYDNYVSDIVIQPNNKLLVTGRNINQSYKKLNGVSRLNTNNTWDSSFNPKIPLAQIDIIKYQPDNKILIGYIESGNISKLVRINNNGTIDKSFRISSYNNSIHSILFQANGKVFLSGSFTTFDEEECPSFIRLNKDGSFDHTFNYNKWEYLYASVMIEQPDGKILVGGNMKPKYVSKGVHFIRLNEDGIWDPSFKLISMLDFQSEIKAIHVQKDGKIILGGRFLSSNWNRNIIRLNGDGEYDTTFKTVNGFNRPVAFILAQGENKIIVAGEFDTCNQIASDRIVRLYIKDESKLNISISPNPSTGIFKINSSQPVKLITITDALGREILRTSPMTYDTQIDLKDEASGLYIIQVYSDNGSKCQKILKQ